LGTPYAFGAAVTPAEGATLDLYAVKEETTADILTPSGGTTGDYNGFRILRGKWYNETAAKITYLVRVNENSAPDYIKGIIEKFSITAELSYGFEDLGDYTNIFTADSLDLTPANVGGEVEVEGVPYREISFNITDTLKSGIVDFTLTYKESGEILTAGTQTALIPCDTDKNAVVDAQDHNNVYNYLKGYDPLPQKMSADGYRYELADVNDDGRINTLDHTVIYNMFKGTIESN
jgi:hypothetical protein